MRSGSNPWAFQAHPYGWALCAAMGLGYLVAIHREDPAHPGAYRPTRRQAVAFAGSLLCLVAALTWPLADLASHWSLSALIVQRMILTLGVAPLAIIGTPQALLARLSRPAAIDRLALWVSRPLSAFVVFGVIVIGTLLPVSVAAASRDSFLRGAFDLLMLVAGIVLWAPVLQVVPGVDRVSPIARAVYLFVQSLVPTFPAIIYVFARHAIYPAFAGSHHAIGLSPLDDQELAGILAKIATLPVLWSAAAVIINRAQNAERAGRDPDTLTWLDVERRLERVERGRSQHEGTSGSSGDLRP